MLPFQVRVTLLTWAVVAAVTAAMWSIVANSDGSQSPCTMSNNGCIQSPNFGGNSHYPINQKCTIQVDSENSRTIDVQSFETERNYDFLIVNGGYYSHRTGPDDVLPDPGSQIIWTSDYSVTKNGWKICPGATVSIPSCNEDLTGNGQDYQGCQTMTRGGRTCQAWASQTPHQHGYTSSDLTENYCRNPGGDRDTIWCFTTDAAVEWEYCDTATAMWSVEDNGPCTIEPTTLCLLSPNYPNDYSNKQFCRIRIDRDRAGPIVVADFQTESFYDQLIIDRFIYSGTRGPAGVTPVGDFITWSSDYSITSRGWKLCPPEPTTTTVPQTEGPTTTTTETTTTPTTTTLTITTVSSTTTDTTTTLTVTATSTTETSTGTSTVTSTTVTSTTTITTVTGTSTATTSTLDGTRTTSTVSTYTRTTTTKTTSTVSTTTVTITSSSTTSSTTTSSTTATTTLTTTTWSSTTSSTVTSSTTSSFTVTTVTTSTSSSSSTTTATKPHTRLKCTLQLEVDDPAAQDLVNTLIDLFLRSLEALKFDVTNIQVIVEFKEARRLDEEVTLHRRLNTLLDVVYTIIVAQQDSDDDATADALQNSAPNLAGAFQNTLQNTSTAWTVSAVSIFNPLVTTTTLPPVDCQWDDWQVWSKCSRACGGGERTRLRAVRQREQHGGNPCAGSATETEVCETDPCLECPVGFFLDTAISLTECAPCLAGRHNPSSGGVDTDACLPCPPGMVSEQGAGQCDPCRAGTAVSQLISTQILAVHASNITGFTRTARHLELSGGATGLAEFRIECSSTDSNTLQLEVASSGVGLPSFEVKIDGQPSSSFTTPHSSSLAWSADSPSFTVSLGSHALSLQANGDSVTLATLQLQGQCGFVHPSELFCGKCDPGSFSGSDASPSCSPCSAGSYIEAVGATACELCGNGTYNNLTGSNHPSSCLNCPTGRAGTRPGLPSPEACNPCSRGRFAGVTGLTECVQCGQGQLAEAEGASACDPCPSGRFNEELGRDECDGCFRGTYLPLTGSVSNDSCLACPGGTEGPEVGMSSCGACGLGTFSVTRAIECSNCSFGLYTDEVRSTACKQCPIGRAAASIAASACEVCTAGRYGAQDAMRNIAVCEPCEAGRASVVVGSTTLATCAPCEDGEFSTEGSTTCGVCTPGTYSLRLAGACTPCEGGTFTAQQGASSCDACSEGTYRGASDPGDTCIPCAMGRYNPSNSSDSAAECLACPAGRFSSTEGASDLISCLTCPAGKHSPPGSVACETCPSGTYSLAGAGTCTGCNAGRYANNAESSECKDCEQGRYRPLGTNASDCLECQAGKASDALAADLESFCVPCSRGTFSSVAGRTICSLCPRGAHAGQPGQTVCNSCNAKSDTPEGAAACCPHDDADLWPVSVSGSLSAPPGKSETRIYFEDGCSAADLGLASDFVFEGMEMGGGQLKLGTLQGSKMHDNMCLSCGGSCGLKVHATKDIFLAGQQVEIQASVQVFRNSSLVYQTCRDEASIMIVGFGCSSGTLSYFLLALAGLVVLTLLLGMLVEVVLRSRLIHLLECSMDMFVSGSSAAMPTREMLREAIIEGLSLPRNKLPPEQFQAWLVRDLRSGSGVGASRVLHIEFSIQARGRESEVLRKQLLAGSWEPGPGALAIGCTRVEQQPPAVMKGRGQAPGLEIFVLLEQAAAVCLGGVEKEGGGQKELHLMVAREVLKRLTSKAACFILLVQYLSNIAAASLLPYYGFLLMNTCEEGFPGHVHLTWLGYVVFSGFLSLVLLRLCLGGPRAREFCWRFHARLVVRMIFACIMLTDMYQDATFTVIAKKCGFGLWFVSAWLIAVGMGVMQVLVQFYSILCCAWQYHRATTPERRESLLVEMIFIALRGSDNLTLVYAVRPAVEEQLGGASSWAMKMSEARIAFFRFIFEDVEQSALQVVFVIFYEDAALADKIWVSLSIATSLLLSFTLVVQCLPEVRDWIWYRVFSRLPLAKALPLLRLIYIFMAVGLYRACSAFPWISACSPSGDPCRDDFPWGCQNERLTLAGLPARTGVVNEVFLTSSWCTGLLSGAILLCSIVWGCRRRAQSKLSKVNIIQPYYSDNRFRSSEHGLRPKTDADTDMWLFPARDVYRIAMAAGSSGHIPQKVMRRVINVDESLFLLAQRRGQAFGRRGDSRMKRQFKELKDLCPKLGDEAVIYAENLRKKAQSALELAKVREEVRKLISTQRFLRADLVSKARDISRATNNKAPLLLVPWSVLEGLGELPRYGTPNTALPPDELLGRVATKLQVARGEAKRRLVIFFLSHRWLRVKGPRSSHHPDSQNNVKASRLVAFARWFMKLAERKGLKLEVAFWIDYSCCEQDDPVKMAIGISALPLYIASCTKILAWRTPDFERRCWTMVERVLSYSFCLGGLTPYAIDETFGEGDDERDVALKEDLPADTVLLDFGETPDATTETTPSSAPASMSLSMPGGADFGPRLFDSTRPPEVGESGGLFGGDTPLIEANETMSVPRGSLMSAGSVGEAPVPRSSFRSSVGRLSRGGSFSWRSKGKSKVAHSSVHRRARKLPNPLDPQTCHLTRQSDRREIALLVELALSVPAFEVFADRQPIEWGITEIIEQLLGSRYDLPSNWTETDASFDGWLTHVEVPQSREWQLIVRMAESLHDISGRDEAEAIVWVDHGSGPVDDAPPAPEEIEALFQRVDDAMMSGDGRVGHAKEADVRALILALKADFKQALSSEDSTLLEAAALRAPNIDLPEKQMVIEKACDKRLQAALESGDESIMRGALRLVRSHGMEHLPGVALVRAEQEKLYDRQLTTRLEALLTLDIDFDTLTAVHYTAKKYHLDEIQEKVRISAFMLVSTLRAAGDLRQLTHAKSLVAAEKWDDILTAVEEACEELTMKHAMEAAAGKDDIQVLRAIEERADTQGYEELRQATHEKVLEVASRIGERMGLPPDWDVVWRVAETDIKKMLRKSEEEETGLLVQKVQELMNVTFTGWGGYGKRTRTRDRGKEDVASELKVMSVIRVQNAESYVNYRGRRKKVEASVKAAKDLPIGEYWDVKTSRVSLEGVSGSGNPVDPMINEHYLWHGTDPRAAEGITDSYFDLKRAGSKYGALFGPGIYLAESCMKADEYVHADSRGFFPMLLCRVCLGRINLVDTKTPAKIGAKLESSCKPGGQYDSVLGDREKVSKTFREFIVFDSHQVYPEFIVWYTRVMDGDK